MKASNKATTTRAQLPKEVPIITMANDEDNIDIPFASADDENSAATHTTTATSSSSKKKPFLTDIVTDLPQDIGSPRCVPQPQKFEIFLARKLLSRYGSKSLPNFFIKMDIDKDGFITCQDLYRTFHNVLGIDLTDDQLDIMFTRMEIIKDEKAGKNGDLASSLCYNTTPRSAADETGSIISSPSNSIISYPSVLLNIGDSFCGSAIAFGSGRVRYRDFKRYVLKTADTTRYTPSEIDYSATIDLNHVENDDELITEEGELRLSNISQESNTSALTSSTTGSVSSSRRHSPRKYKSSVLLSIVPPPNAVTLELRVALRRLLEQHSKKSRGRGGSMAETTLFLEMDTNRNGYVTPSEFQELIATWGLVLSDEQVRIILGKHYPTEEKEGIDLKEFIQFIEEMDENTHGLRSPMPWELVDTENESKRLIAKERVEKLYSQRELDNIKEREEKQKKKRRDDSKTNIQLAALLSEKIYVQFHTVLQAFTRYSQDGQHRGKLSVLELHRMMNHLGLDVSENRVLELVKKFDGDGDGFLSKGDFVRLIASSNDKEEKKEDPGSKKESDEKKSIQEEEGSKKSAASSPLSASRLEKSDQSSQGKAASVGVKPIRSLVPKEGEKELRIPSTNTMSQNTASHVLSQSSSITTTTTTFDPPNKEEEEPKEEIIKLIRKFRDAMEHRTARKAFEMMDVDRSKYLTIDQLKRGYEKLGIKISDEQVNQIMNRFDPDRTGQMRYHQFLKMLSSNLDQQQG